MPSLTSTVRVAGASVVAKAGKDCIVCQDTFSEENMETRACGHATCHECDSEWRKQGSISCTKVRDAHGTTHKKYHVKSTCPLCRAEDTYANVKLRSKQSLATELSIALGMLYRINRTKLESPVISPQAVVQPAGQMDDLTRQVIDQLIAEGQIQGPAVLAAVRPLAVPAHVRAQVAPRPVAPAVVAPVPPRPAPVPPVAVAVDEPYHNYGLLRHRQPRNDICANGAFFRCVTAKTKLKCPRCNVALCRTCKNQCPHCPAA